MTTPTSTYPDIATGTWNIDPSHTEVGFVARHLMVSKVRGRFAEVSGTVEVPENIVDSRVDVTVTMASIDTRNEDRDNHLRSGDFFDVETYPEMTFVSTAFSGDTLTGDLTIKDVTKSVTFDVEFGGAATDPWGNSKAGFEATASIKRSEFGLNWNVALEAGGVMVSDKIDIVLDVQLIKSA